MMATSGAQLNGHGRAVTPKQEALIAALLATPTIQEAAKAAGVPEHTAHRWLRDDDAFKAAYMVARRDALRQATARLTRASSGVVNVLLQIAADKGAPASARVTACRTVLEFAYRAEELEDLSARLDALEQSLGGQRR